MPRISKYVKVDPLRKASIARHETSSVIPVRVWKALYEGPQTFTADDLAQRSESRPSSIYRWLYAMEEQGWVERYDVLRSIGPRETIWRRVHHLHPLEPTAVV